MNAARADGRARVAARSAVFAGLVYGGLQFAESGDLLGSAVGGLLFGCILGPVTAARMWSGWSGANQISPSDRANVARCVRQGSAVDDARLAPAVIDYAAVIRDRWQKERRDRWVLLAFAAGTLAAAVGETAFGSTRGAVFWWFLVVLWVALLAWQPRKRKRALSRAADADAAARTKMRTAPRSGA